MQRLWICFTYLSLPFPFPLFPPFPFPPFDGALLTDGELLKDGLEDGALELYGAGLSVGVQLGALDVVGELEVDGATLPFPFPPLLEPAFAVIAREYTKIVVSFIGKVYKYYGA